MVHFGTGQPRVNLNSLFIMNSAGEEDEEQVDYGGDSGEENSMSFNRQARSTIWRRMLCSRCIPADLLPGFGLTVNIEILRAKEQCARISARSQQNVPAHTSACIWIRKLDDHAATRGI